ncbi:spermidine/putrescine ABC transporter substrate-binding protein [Halovenus rubra]|uniref:Spermidine/putrescine ABC transporter substrate-binding protein n=2 Tax=Halovenus rubra TaxID=869890 RepID=A0ACC7DZ55_9EURY|nr:spermidine/putrescine ABC transporter substrate-binding protein [Halovenus rubra]
MGNRAPRLGRDNRSCDRRSFCATVLCTGSTVGLGGCLGGGGGSGVTSAIEPVGNEQFRRDLGLPEPKDDIESELNLLVWTEYWHPNTIRDFEVAYDVSVTSRYYRSNEELYQILAKDGLDMWDIIVPSSWMVSRMIDEELLQPIEVNRLTNWFNLDTRWISDAPYDIGSQRYSVPSLWGTTGIAWHENLVNKPIDELDITGSWDALWDKRFAKQIQLLKLPRELYAAALKRLGYSLNSTDEQEIAEATEILVRQKELANSYAESGFTQTLINEQATPVHTFSGDAITARKQLYEDGSSPIRYRIPREGGVKWVDSLAISKKAQHPNAALTFIDYSLNKTISARNTNFSFYATPNEEAKTEVLPELLDDPGVYPPDYLRENLEFIEHVGDTTTAYQNGWETIQNA